ncbi:MAG: polyprenyl synthetase family protein [Deltaproteobacteria bacterium]|nr:polyprenyl synthetase family protein [Deltaproteobacteria bacterium]
MSATCSARGSDAEGRDLSAYARRRKLVDDNLLRFLRPDVCAIPAGLRAAMEYSLTAGGKRIRPVVLLSAGAAVGGGEEELLPFACAVEYVHTYSLIHDDLPAMDDDDYRRGRPTCHKAFGEAAAILAGDALLTEAFRVTGESPLSAREPGRAVRAIAVLARAAGAEGMVGGQQMDLSPDLSKGPAAGIEAIDLRKTAALLSAAARMGGILGGGTAAQVGSLAAFGRALGLLFQVTDDILDETGNFEELGKGVAKDRGRGKLTYPIALGMETARSRAEGLAREAVAALAVFGAAGQDLREIVQLVSHRRS